MKFTLEIPDHIVRRAKSLAVERGISLGQLVTEAVQDKLKAPSKSAQKPWMKSFGKLRHLRRETQKINRIIDQEFERIEPEDREPAPDAPPTGSSRRRIRHAR